MAVDMYMSQINKDKFVIGMEIRDQNRLDRPTDRRVSEGTTDTQK